MERALNKIAGVRSGRVGSGWVNNFSNLAGRVGSGKGVSKSRGSGRVGSDRAGSRRVEFFAGRVGSGATRPKPWGHMRR